MTKYELHPLCTLFPRISGNDFQTLVADIKANGLRDPITVLDGMILDGGNRYAACLEAGIEPVSVEFDGDSIIGFVLSKNFYRRHLSVGQQAAIISSMADWENSCERGGTGANQHRKEQSATNSTLQTISDRATESGASKATQRKADAVVKADPELGRKVATGEISLNAATKQVAPQLTNKKKVDDGYESELDRRQDQLKELQMEFQRVTAENDSLRDDIAIRSEDLPEEEQTTTKELIASLRQQVIDLERNLDAVTISRNTLQTTVNEQARLVKYWKKQAESVVA